MYLIGYDIGSSSIKTALVRADTREVVDLIQYPEQEMDMISRQKGWAEQQPELWWRYLCLSTKKIIKKNKIKSKDILSIGISYQMHGLVIVNKDKRVLRPAIIWCDSRSVSIGDRAFDDLGHEHCLSHYQNSPGNFTASKLKWVKDNEPDIYKNIYKIMLPGDYIAMKLTNKINTTVSGLSEAVLWDFKNNKLANKILDYYDLDHELIPDLVPTFAVSGELTKKASKETGLAKGIPVSYRAGDQPNNALSLNVLRPGEIAATSGTSGVVYGVVDKLIYDSESRVNAFAHVNHETKKKRIGVLLCINGAGIQYGWIRSQMARPERTYEDMERMLTAVPVGSEGVCVLPFGNGSERIFNNRNLESHIRNIEFNRHTRAHIYRAALEGVAFTFVHGIDLLKEMGIKINSMRVGYDNMFKSKVFATTIATLLGINIEVVETTGAVGAALASGYGCGHFNSLEAVMKKIKPLKVYKPASNYGDYNQAYTYWRDALSQLVGAGTGHQISEKEKEEIVIKDKLIAQQSIMLEAQQRQLDRIKLAMKKSSDDSSTAEIRKILNTMDNTSSTELSHHLNLMNDPFVEAVKKAYPSLSFEELKLCYLLKMKFSTKQIAKEINLSYRGAETKRYRLRQKLNIPKGTSIDTFLTSF